MKNYVISSNLKDNGVDSSEQFPIFEPLGNPEIPDPWKKTRICLGYYPKADGNTFYSRRCSERRPTFMKYH